VVLVTEADNGLRTAHTVLARITQPNGIALLVCAALILIWMIFRCVMQWAGSVQAEQGMPFDRLS
jgi:hypothetical protein